MVIDLQMLLFAVVLTLVQCVIAVVGAMLQVGLPTLAGNHENFPVITGWAGRAQRAHRNVLESLVLFAILVLTAVVTERANAMTALGAEIFLGARVVYLIVYLIGVPWLRTLTWAASIAGLILILSQLL